MWMNLVLVCTCVVWCWTWFVFMCCDVCVMVVCNMLLLYSAHACACSCVLTLVCLLCWQHVYGLIVQSWCLSCCGVSCAVITTWLCYIVCHNDEWELWCVCKWGGMLLWCMLIVCVYICVYANDVYWWLCNGIVLLVSCALWWWYACDFKVLVSWVEICVVCVSVLWSVFRIVHRQVYIWKLYVCIFKCN